MTPRELARLQSFEEFLFDNYEKDIRNAVPMNSNRKLVERIQ